MGNDTRKVRSESGAVFKVRDSMVDGPERDAHGPFREAAIASVEDIRPSPTDAAKQSSRRERLRARLPAIGAVTLVVLGAFMGLFLGCVATPIGGGAPTSATPGLVGMLIGGALGAFVSVALWRTAFPRE
jgi:hypothetical protein